MPVAYLPLVSTDGIEVVTAGGEIDICTAPRLGELLIDLTGKGNSQLIVDVDEVGFLGSTGLGGAGRRAEAVRPRDGSLDLVCSHEQILNIFRVSGLTTGSRWHGTSCRGSPGPGSGQGRR